MMTPQSEIHPEEQGAMLAHRQRWLVAAAAAAMQGAVGATYAWSALFAGRRARER